MSAKLTVHQIIPNKNEKENSFRQDNYFENDGVEESKIRVDFVDLNSAL